MCLCVSVCVYCAKSGRALSFQTLRWGFHGQKNDQEKEKSNRRANLPETVVISLCISPDLDFLITLVFLPPSFFFMELQVWAPSTRFVQGQSMFLHVPQLRATLIILHSAVCFRVHAFVQSGLRALTCACSPAESIRLTLISLAKTCTQ